MTALNVAMGPITIVILAIASAIAAGILIWKNWDKIMDKVKIVLEKFSPVIEFLKKVWDRVWEKMTGPIEKVMDVLGFLKDMWDKIWDKMADPIETVIGTIKGFLNIFVNALNWIIRGINKIGFKVPDWIPKWGGKEWGFDIPQIPKLAEGGIVTKPTLAMIGERGPEAVVPLNRGTTGVTVNINGPVYGFSDFEDKVTEAVRDSVRRGGFSGILATE
jgi:phage-related minor tail protein